MRNKGREEGRGKTGKQLGCILSVVPIHIYFNYSNLPWKMIVMGFSLAFSLSLVLIFRRERMPFFYSLLWRSFLSIQASIVSYPCRLLFVMSPPFSLGSLPFPIHLNRMYWAYALTHLIQSQYNFVAADLYVAIGSDKISSARTMRNMFYIDQRHCTHIKKTPYHWSCCIKIYVNDVTDQMKW